MVRTTVALDPDLDVRLKEMARGRGLSFKAAINAALRAGLDAETPNPKPNREKPRDLGMRPEVELSNYDGADF